ncbi:MAG: hypothetical protein AAF371_09995 [Pseudomonadota bacterium]
MAWSRYEHLVFFGVRSPMTVEFEETCRRLDRPVLAGVSRGGSARAVLTAVIVDDPPDTATHYLPCAFEPGRRRALSADAETLGLAPADALIDPTAVVAASSSTGEGSFVNAGAVIGGATILGRCVLVNRAASVGHHCVLEDFATIGPGATLTGGIRLGMGATVGAGAVLLPGIAVGEGALIAAGSLVREDVAAGAFVAGSPAVERPFDRARSKLFAAGEE